MGHGLCRDQARPAVRAAVHVPHAALLVRPAVPRAGGGALAAALAADARRASPRGGGRAADARGAARREPLCAVPGHVGGGGGSGRPTMRITWACRGG